MGCGYTGLAHGIWPTELHTEILWKIWQDYKDFDPELMDNIDRLYFIYLTLDSPVSGEAGGTPSLACAIPNDPEHQDAFAFYHGIANTSNQRNSSVR